MNAVFLKILNMGITGGWLVLAVLFLRLIFARAPKWIRCALWAIVALRLILPFSLPSAVSAFQSTAPVQTIEKTQVLPETGERTVKTEVVLESGITQIDEAISPAVSRAQTSETVKKNVDPVALIVKIAAIVWIAGGAGLLLYALIAWLRLKKRVAPSVPLEENVRICDGISSPFILGVFRPRIYLPSGLSDEERTHVLAHERAHLKRGDHLFKPLGYLLLAVYWFHPLMWLAYILFCRDVELACDEKVIRDLSAEDRAAYSETLLRLSSRNFAAAACPLAFGETGVGERVKKILRYKKPALWGVIAAVLVLALLAGCTLTDPKRKQNKNDAFTEEEYNDYKLPERISELPSNEQITKDIDNGIVYLTYMYEDLSGGETTFTYYKFTDLPQLETRTWAQRNETRFRGEYKLEAEIIPVRGLQILVNPWVTVFEPGVYGLFEKEIMKLSFEATENRPAGNYANWRLTNAAGGETTYAVYVDGKVTKTKVNADGSGTFEIASSTISEECAAFFYGRNMMLGAVNKEEDDDLFLDGSYGAAQSLYVRKDGEVKLLSVEQSAALLEALGCKKSDQGYRGYVVSVYHEVNVKPGEDKKELFRFKEATPSMETESGYADPDENYEFWYRVYEDGTVACFREGYGYVMERPFIVSVRLRRIERFSNTGDAEKALAAIS